MPDTTEVEVARGTSRLTTPSPALIRRAQTGDARARDRVVRAMLPMAEHVARRFAGEEHLAEDLAQVAGIGLLKAIERYDHTRDAAFATYAHALMTGEVRRHLRDVRMVRVPRSVYEQVPAFQRAVARLRSELRREPTRAEIAAALGVSVEDVIEVADAASASQPVSLDAAREDAGSEGSLGETDAGFERVEAGADLQPMLAALGARERMILDLRFSEGLSQSEIADGMGLSRTQVSRLIRSSLAKLSERAGLAA